MIFATASHSPTRQFETVEDAQAYVRAAYPAAVFARRADRFAEGYYLVAWPSEAVRAAHLPEVAIIFVPHPEASGAEA